MPTTARTFAVLPPETAGALRPVLSGLADETVAAIAVEVPDYARAMEGSFGAAVRRGVEIAFERFLALIEDPKAAERARTREIYVDLGRGEFNAGRSLDALLAAYRVGARLAWRRFVEAGRSAGLPPEVLYDLGEAIFAYIDEISAESADGYAQEQSAAAGEAQRRRRRLVRLLAEEGSEEAVRTAAGAVGWALPNRVAALVAEGDDAAAIELARRTGGGAIGAELDGVACAWVPDADAPGRRRQLEAAVDGRAPAALGPAVDWTAAAASFARAAAALALGIPGPLVVADEHLATLLLADAALGEELAASRLVPLQEVTDNQRERLTETLRAWLDRPGQVQAVAATLGVHPQTVRYRLNQLRELFGDALEDPDARFELSLALRLAALRY